MIAKDDLKKMAEARLKDAEVLYKNRRYDGAIYLCGYAMEFALKARICKTLKWAEFPEGGDYRSFKVHDLTVLLHLSGVEKTVENKYDAQWKIVAMWTPEIRYKMTGKAKDSEARDMIAAAKILMGVLK